MSAIAMEITDEIFGKVFRSKQPVPRQRDRRSMNHMDPETKLVHARLEEWAKWALDGEMRAWPSTTLLGRVMERGQQGASQAGRPPIEIPARVAHVDAAVARLGSIDKRTIKAYYGPGGSIEITARRMRMHVQQARNVLKRARWRITGFLDAMELK